jgi:hypothetical protein
MKRTKWAGQVAFMRGGIHKGFGEKAGRKETTKMI